MALTYRDLRLFFRWGYKGSEPKWLTHSHAGKVMLARSCWQGHAGSFTLYSSMNKSHFIYQLLDNQVWWIRFLYYCPVVRNQQSGFKFFSMTLGNLFLTIQCFSFLLYETWWTVLPITLLLMLLSHFSRVWLCATP